jgi:hypothetical protein
VTSRAHSHSWQFIISIKNNYQRKQVSIYSSMNLIKDYECQKCETLQEVETLEMEKMEQGYGLKNGFGVSRDIINGELYVCWFKTFKD